MVRTHIYSKNSYYPGILHDMNDPVSEWDPPCGCRPVGVEKFGFEHVVMECGTCKSEKTVNPPKGPQCKVNRRFHYCCQACWDWPVDNDEPWSGTDDSLTVVPPPSEDTTEFSSISEHDNMFNDAEKVSDIRDEIFVDWLLNLHGEDAPYMQPSQNEKKRLNILDMNSTHPFVNNCMSNTDQKHLSNGAEYVQRISDINIPDSFLEYPTIALQDSCTIFASKRGFEN